MVKSQADMLVPWVKEFWLIQAFISVSCTRSSARSPLPQSEKAKARRLGIVPSISSFSRLAAASPDNGTVFAGLVPSGRRAHDDLPR